LGILPEQLPFFGIFFNALTRALSGSGALDGDVHPIGSWHELRKYSIYCNVRNAVRPLATLLGGNSLFLLLEVAIDFPLRDPLAGLQSRLRGLVFLCSGNKLSSMRTDRRGRGSVEIGTVGVSLDHMSVIHENVSTLAF
jgi:hypothetical protein